MLYLFIVDCELMCDGQNMQRHLGRLYKMQLCQCTPRLQSFISVSPIAQTGPYTGRRVQDKITHDCLTNTLYKLPDSHNEIRSRLKVGHYWIVTVYEIADVVVWESVGQLQIDGETAVFGKRRRLQDY